MLAPLLWGVGLGSIPVVIHLLQKRRYRETDWAAMRFLLEAIRKNSRRLRIEQLLLLAVRVLIMLLVVAALQGVYDKGLSTFVRDTPLVHKIVVVDTSLSMGVKPDNDLRFSEAKRIARLAVEESRRGDALNLLRIADSPPRVIVRQPTYKQGELLAEIDQLQLTSEWGNVPATLAEIGDLLDRVPDIPNKEIVLISDFQSNNWGPKSGTQSSEIQQQLRALAEKARLIVVELGDPVATNAAVTEINSQEPFAVAGRPVGMTATVQSFGPTTLRNQTVQMLVDGRMVDSRTVALSPETGTQVDFQHTFSDSGEHDVEVRLADDVLSADNSRWLALPVKEQLAVLLVNGVPEGDAAKTATHHLQLALAPSKSTAGGYGIIRPDVINWGELSQTELSRYDCVFLCNVEFFTEREAGMLDAYVRNGGGLIITLGDRVQIDNYNQLLYRDGEGVLPAKLQERVGNPEKKDNVYLFDAASLEHPIVSPFRGNPGSGLEATMTFAYIRATLGKNGNASIVLPFNTSDPAIIDSAFGRGRSILMTTSVDEKWGTWSVWAPSFVPLMYESVYHAVSGRWKERQLTIDQPLTRTVPTRALIQQAKLKTPTGEEIVLPVSGQGEFAQVGYVKTSQQGIYRLTFGPPISRTENYALNIDPRESDLQFLGEQEIRAGLLDGVDATYLHDWEKQQRLGEVTVVHTGGLARWFLGILLALMFVEQFLAWNFRYGVVLLCGLGLILAAQSTLSLSSGFSLVLFVLLAAALCVAAMREARTEQQLPGRHRSS